MKKALCLILSAAAVLCLFASCGKTEDEATTLAAEETSAEAIAETESASGETATAAVTAAGETTSAAANQTTAKAAATEAAASNPDVKYMTINSEPYTVTCKEGFDNYGFSCQLCDSTDTYYFKSSSSSTTWTVYVLDKEFTDAIRMLPQAYSPSLTGNGTIKIKEGKYIYIQCSVNAFTASNPNSAYLEVTRASDNTTAATKAASTIREGNYGDETSQRASATVKKSGDKYIITVSWSSSAAEGYEWTMTATQNGDKLSYTDCKKIEYKFTDDSNRTESTLYSNGTGYFTVKNGKLLWNGAAETECQSCVFA